MAARLMRMAKEHPDPAKREEAAQAYRDLTGKDLAAPAPAGPIADPAEAAQPSMLGKAAGAVKDFVTGPLNAAAAGFNERISGGIYPAALDLIGASSPQYRQKLAQDHPIGDLVGQGTGIAASMVVPGAPAAVIDQAVAHTAAGVAPRLAASGAGQVGRGAVTGALTAGTESLTKGDGTAEGMAKNFEDALLPGAAGGAAFSALGQGMKSGDELLQSVAPRVRDFVQAKRSGAYQSPELKNLAKGGEGVRQASENAGNAVLARDRAIGDRNQRNYDEAIEPYEKSTKIDTGKAQSVLLQKYMDNLHADTGEPMDMALAKALEDEAVKLGDTRTLKGMLDNLKMSRAKADHNSLAPTDENKAYRQVYEAQNQALDDVVPERVKAAREEAHQGLTEERRRHDIIANTEGEISRGQTRDGENTRVTKEKMIARLLQRVGDDNVPGQEARRYLEELAAQDPEIARQIALVRAKKAQEAVRPSFTPLVPLNLAQTNEAGGYGQAARQLGRSAAGHVLQPALEYGGQELGGKGGRLSPGLVPLLRDPIDALVGKKKKKAGGT